MSIEKDILVILNNDDIINNLAKKKSLF